jgi:hypothetical protein
MELINNATKRKSLISIEKGICKIAKKIQNNPFYYFNEEDVRADLYSEIKRTYKHNILLGSETIDSSTNKRNKEESSAIHCDAVIRDDDESEKDYHKIDLLVHYGHRRVPVHFHKGKIHFFKDKSHSNYGIKKHLEKRRIIEIKMSRTTGGIQRTIYKVNSDASKRRQLGFSSAHYVFVCRRSDEIPTKIMGELKKMTDTNRNETVYYISPNEFLRFKRGGMKRL